MLASQRTQHQQLDVLARLGMTSEMQHCCDVQSIESRKIHLQGSSHGCRLMQVVHTPPSCKCLLAAVCLHHSLHDPSRGSTCSVYACTSYATALCFLRDVSEPVQQVRHRTSLQGYVSSLLPTYWYVGSQHCLSRRVTSYEALPIWLLSLGSSRLVRIHACSEDQQAWTQES